MSLESYKILETNRLYVLLIVLFINTTTSTDTTTFDTSADNSQDNADSGSCQPFLHQCSGQYMKSKCADSCGYCTLDSQCNNIPQSMIDNNDVLFYCQSTTPSILLVSDNCDKYSFYSVDDSDIENRDDALSRAAIDCRNQNNGIDCGIFDKNGAICNENNSPHFERCDINSIPDGYEKNNDDIPYEGSVIFT
eukprot:UN32624